MTDIGPRRDLESLLAHSAWIRGLVRALVLDSSQVDDVVQETWLAAIEGPRRRWLDPRAWLGGVARNLARETHRKDARRVDREANAARSEALPSADELAEKAELQSRVAKAVLELEEPYRSTLLLRYFGELTAEEIARREGLPGSTVRNRLKHGLDRLRARFDREHGGDRRTWAMALLPLVRHGGNTGAAPIAPGALSTSWTGESLMLSKIWIGVATAFVVTGGTTAVLVRREPPQQQRMELETPSQAAGTRHDARDAAPVPAVATGPHDEPRLAVATAVAAHPLRGELRDQHGAPIEGAMIFVGGWRDPFAGASHAEVALELASGNVLHHALDKIHTLDLETMQREGLMLGRLFATDARGGFAAQLPDAGRAWVQVSRTLGVRPLAGAGAWYLTSEDEIELTAQRIPTASVSIRVFDETTAGPLPGFAGEIRELRPDSAATEGAAAALVEEFCASKDGVARVRLEIEGGPEQYEVRLDEPLWARSSESLRVAAGTEQELAFSVRSEAGLSGEVTDERGTAVEGALVFWGDQLRMRGYNSFTGAFHEKCVPEAVRTDARGRFTLPGRAELVSAWHAQLSPTTVPASEATSLRLTARGSLRGQVLDEQGSPVAGVRVELDREQGTTTDASGMWSFERLEAGLHGIELPGHRSLVARVPSGATLDVDVDWIGDVTVEVLSGGAPYHEDFGGVLVGSGRVFLIREFETEQGQLGVWNAIPGRYHLISRSGRIAQFDVAAGTNATVELGDADLTVHATPGERVYLIPAEADDVLLYWCRRSPVEASPSGTAIWKPLTRGQWQVATEDRGVVASVRVAGPGAEISIE